MTNRGTLEGNDEEINFVRLLNKKENLNFWEILRLNPINHYAIHVIYHKFSEINQRKVKPKADIYIAQGDVPYNLLKENDYYLNEDNVEEFNLSPIEKTGISVKLKDSKRMTITKMGPNTFKAIFGSYELGAGASIYCKNEQDLIKNNSVIEGWHTNQKDFVQYFKNENLDIAEDIDYESANIIKKFSNEKIEEIIKNDEIVSNFIFQGIGNFEEPFTVHYLYENGELKDSCVIPFKPTTGSGRSRGDYTIVIKPK